MCVCAMRGFICAVYSHTCPLGLGAVEDDVTQTLLRFNHNCKQIRKITQSDTKDNSANRSSGARNL